VSKVKPADNLREFVRIRHDLADLTECREDVSEQSMEELQNRAWEEVLALFEGDETGARGWMKRNRPYLGNVTPEEMLDSAEGIRRLRQFVQQLERGVLP
tara:strand:+ start:726 stop:1025 length:300 start_codon:yes stop_codon:yes gene_type:complete